MIVTRRMVDRQRSYTGIFLPGEPARIFPTSDFEHARILQIYKQDKAYEGIINDFTDDSGSGLSSPGSPASTATARAARPASPHPRKKTKADPQHRKTGQKRRP